MHLIAGLGNPGKEYEKTRHNVGFVAIDYLAETLGVKIKKIKFKGIYTEVLIGQEKCILLKPQTFMNASGESIREAMEFFKITPQNLIVLYDDTDIPTGSVRIRPSGSAGGHNGMKSIIYLIDSDCFPRVRFGIGKPEYDMTDHVLGTFNDDDGKKVTEAVKNIPDIVSLIVSGNTDEAMNKYNKKVN